MNEDAHWKWLLFKSIRKSARVFFFTLHSHFNPIVDSQHTSPHHGLKEVMGNLNFYNESRKLDF